MDKHVILVILDGWGYRKETEHNAIAEAKKPFYDHLLETYPNSLLKASGGAVGLPDNQMGNSEVGHLTIGAGTPIDTDFVRINKAIENNEIASNEAFNTLFKHVKENGSRLHFLGLVSPGGVHSHMDQLIGLIRIAKKEGIGEIVIHAILDGRDTPPQSGAGFVEQFENEIQNLENVNIATISGRYYAMDRDHNWDRIEKAYEAIFNGKGDPYENKKASEVIKELYAKGQSDEFIVPSVLANDSKVKIIERNDGVCFFNFRADRAREMSKKIIERKNELNLCFVTMTEYEKGMDCLVAFPPLIPKITLAKVISDAGLSQIHIAETEKYAHVTYFLNGGDENPHKNEQFVLVNSRKDIPTFDKAPKMCAAEITGKAFLAIDKNPAFIAINYANADMVGHSGDENATIVAVEAIDSQLKRLVEYALQKKFVVFITADHGNAEINVYPNTEIKHTTHTNNPVPAILTIKDDKLRNGGLADVAPTILQVLGLNKPKAMTGESLIA